MKVRNWPLVMISIYIFIITGCSIGLENEEQRIEVHKNIGLCFTLFNTAIILFFLWFGYHFT